MKNIFVVLSLYVPLSGFAYNTSNHEAITQHAIYLLNRQCKDVYITLEEAKMIIKGNVSEDAFGFKWAIRWCNQHFYNPLKERKHRKRIYSINERFERIAKRCFRRVGSKKYFKYVGEIVHHIQDMTNPSHVVPVYHGPGLKDKFDEHYLTCYFPDTIEINLSLPYDTPYLSSILKPVAEKTLDALKQRFDIYEMRNGNCVRQTIDWSKYWNENPEGWFGQYGEIGKPDKSAGQKIDNYVVEEIHKGDTTYYVDRRIYDDFSTQQVELAVIETARFLYYAKKKYVNKKSD